MKKIIIASTFLLVSLYSFAQVKQIDSTYHRNVNPYREIKKGVILTSIGTLGLCTSLYYATQNELSTTNQKVLFGTAFVSSGFLTILGTIYKVQGLNLIYRPNKSGYWSTNIGPGDARIAFHF